jgi:site-specific DNA recombinase
MTDGPLRIGLWCAVSTPEQATVDRDSLPAQEADGRAWAEGMGGEVVRVYTVPGHSRKYLFYHEAAAEMAAYGQIEADCQAGALDVLWCRNRNRLGRTLALIAQVDGLVREVGHAEVYSAAMPHAIGKAASRSSSLMAAVEGWMAESENAERTHLHKMGMRGRVKRGLIATRPPTGYSPIRDESGRTVAYRFNEDRAAVEAITRLFLAGHSYAEISRQMRAGPYPPPSGTQWWLHTIRRILQNDHYAGFPFWGSVSYADHSDTPSSQYPALWDAETFREIQRERLRRSRGPYHRTGGGPFTGAAVCGRCGGAMHREFKHSGQKWYLMCRNHKHKSLEGHACHPNYIQERKVIAAVSKFLAWLSRQVEPEALEEVLRPDDSAHRRIEEEIAQLGALADDLQAQRERLALALASGQMDASMYRTTDDGLLERLTAAHRTEGELRRALQALPDLEARREALELLSEDFAGLLRKRQPAYVAQLLQTAGCKIYIEDGEVVEIEIA